MICRMSATHFSRVMAQQGRWHNPELAERGVWTLAGTRLHRPNEYLILELPWAQRATKKRVPKPDPPIYEG